MPFHFLCMLLSDFDFVLPKSHIAQNPVNPRDAARMLVVDDQLVDTGVADLTRYLREGDILVFNNTRVIPARLFGRRGLAKIEIMLHKEEAEGQWWAFIRPAKRVQVGEKIEIAPGFHAIAMDKRDGGEVKLVFNLQSEDFRNALRQNGHVPLPPYIDRDEGVLPEDIERYQTVYAAAEGAVAAPTAGLHFTERLLQELASQGVGSAFVTLHVGAGTFLPVKTENIQDHKMHAEYAVMDEVAAQKINAARQRGGRVVAVGTTSLRVLETVADEQGNVRPFAGETDIFITPGYRFKTVDVLMTNFHLPKSTLFMLVSAFVGLERMQEAYRHAVAQNYRFYSYGDASLLFRAVL